MSMDLIDARIQEYTQAVKESKGVDVLKNQFRLKRWQDIKRNQLKIDSYKCMMDALVK